MCYTVNILILTAKIKLNPTPEQHKALKDTVYRINQACNWISQQAWVRRIFSRFALQKKVYKDVRATFGLSSQVAIHAVRKVADAYKKGKETQRAFKKMGAVPYDERVLKIWVDKRLVSIWTLEGREKMPFVAGNRQLELLRGKHKETDLCYIKGEFYLFVSCEVDEPDERDVEEFVGVDLGIATIATDSDGVAYAGGTVNGLRNRHVKVRRCLQSKGTKASRRLLKHRRRKERHFANDVNHCISKELVERAERTGRGIALEDLTGIRDRVRVKKAQRWRHHSWAFHDLRLKIEYKAKLLGIPVVLVDPRNTSRTCHKCGHCERDNRKSQKHFACRSCGYISNADYNAACNIAGRAVDVVAAAVLGSDNAVNQPNVSDVHQAALAASGA